MCAFERASLEASNTSRVVMGAAVVKAKRWDLVAAADEPERTGRFDLGGQVHGDVAGGCQRRPNLDPCGTVENGPPSCWLIY